MNGTLTPTEVRVKVIKISTDVSRDRHPGANAMKKKDRPFNEIYNIDAATNLYMVEIALDQYADIFNQWDPTPFKRREIDPDLQLYLEGSSDEIPSKYPIELCFIVPPDKKDQSMEEEIRQGLRNSFIFKLYLIKKQLKKNNTQAFACIILGFGFLWIATLLSRRFEPLVLPTLLTDGLIIGGWVFLWEAVSLFFFTNRELYERYSTYKRLQTAPVIFQVAKKLVPN